jgi:hypothetical protein
MPKHFLRVAMIGMKNENNDREILSPNDTFRTAIAGLAISILILLYAGFQGARILSIRGEIGARTFVTEKISRSYQIKTRNRPTDYYQCYNAEGGERCITVGIGFLGKKAGEPLQTIRIWDGNTYHISDPYLENLSMYLVQLVIFGLIALFCLIKIIFPRFEILQKFNDTRTVKLFDA